MARVEDRTFICSLSKDNAGPTNNWENPLRDAPQAEGAVRRLHAGRTMYVLPSAWARSVADVADRRAAHRFALRGREHAHHGAHRAAVFSTKSIKTTSASCRACTAWARRLAAGPERRALAVQQGKIHRPLSRDPRNLVLRFRLRRQRAAGQEMFRAAHRLQHRARRRLDGRAHADPRRRGSARAKRPMSPRLFPAPAARPISPC